MPYTLSKTPRVSQMPLLSMAMLVNTVRLSQSLIWVLILTIGMWCSDWVIEKGDVVNLNSTEGELALLLTQTNGGTKIASTRYLHYGTVTTTLKTGRWAGVVTAFITMSNIKDEIDWEFPGAMTTQGQTNYFWQGVIRALFIYPLCYVCLD